MRAEIASFGLCGRLYGHQNKYNHRKARISSERHLSFWLVSSFRCKTFDSRPVIRSLVKIIFSTRQTRKIPIDIWQTNKILSKLSVSEFRRNRSRHQTANELRKPIIVVKSPASQSSQDRKNRTQAKIWWIIDRRLQTKECQYHVITTWIGPRDRCSNAKTMHSLRWRRNPATTKCTVSMTSISSQISTKTWKHTLAIRTAVHRRRQQPTILRTRISYFRMTQELTSTTQAISVVPHRHRRIISRMWTTVLSSITATRSIQREEFKWWSPVGRLG